MTGQRILVCALILGLLLAPGGVSQAQELRSSPVLLRSVANAPVLPDLIVTDIWPVGKAIHYQLWNAGAATAPAGHYTGLTIDSFSFPPDSVNVALAPGERARRTFPQYGWTCSGISDTIKACADAGTTVWESDENNNCREETLLCDQAPPVITAGPTVKADETAATVTWQTDEDCLGVVKYGPQAGVFATQVQEVGGTQNHELVLEPLELATVYHYVAQCADASGNTVTADDAFFQTYPPMPGQPPDLGTPTVTRDEGEAERYTISVPVSDTFGVERVEFYLDGELVGIDYSPDPLPAVGVSAPQDVSPGFYSCTLDPAQRKLSRAAFFNHSHAFVTEAFDRTGMSAHTQMMYEPTYELPDIELTVWPRTEQFRYVDAPGDSLPAGQTISLDVEAHEEEYWCSFVPGTEVVHCDDVQLVVDRVVFSLDGTPVHTWDPGAGEFDYTYDWDVGGLGVGDYTMRVRAYGAEGGSSIRDVELHVEVGTPSLDVSREVIREGNFFRVRLTLENEGTATADVGHVRDYVTGFQPIVAGTDTYSVTSDYWAETRHCDVEIDLFSGADDFVSLAPGSSMVLEYNAVPILHPDPATFEYGIGEYDRVKIWHREDYVRWRLDRPADFVADGDLLAEAVGRAREGADYLIVTYPSDLFAHTGTRDQVDRLLSKMAELAQLKNGVLGYVSDIPAHESDTIRSLIGEWGTGMTGGYGVPGDYLTDGNLLIVGEVEIIGSWDSDHGRRGWVHYTDLPYGNTSGDWVDPELTVGRIVGNDAEELIVSLQTSIDVHRGDGPVYFYKGSALLVSGRGDGVTEFEESVDDASWDLGVIGSPFYEVTVLKQRVVEDDLGLDMRSTFISSIVSTTVSPPGRDLIFYRDHCDWNWWSHVITNTDFPISFGDRAPFAFACCCRAGRYEGLGAIGIAEAFLLNGAGVYIGSTENSNREVNNEAANFFFERWPRSSESIGQSFRAVKWHLDGRGGDYWAAEYNLYGDPKFDLTAAALARLAAAAPAAAPPPSEPITSVDVVVPNFVVTGTLAGGHHVRIPGGGMLLELGKPQVPVYFTEIDYAPGVRVQDVVLTSRSGLTVTSGLVISTTSMALDRSGAYPAAPEDDAEWWPALDADFEWWLRDKPNGSSTLVIKMYPFYYNALTLDAMFYPNYSFEINVISSTVLIERLATDRHEYEQGATVAVDLDISNTGVPTDVVVNAVIRDESSGEVVDGLLLRSLADLTGEATFSSEWDTGDAPAGYYDVEAQIMDAGGHVLDTETQRFRVGICSGEVTTFTATPTLFDIGDTIDVSLVFSNAGTVPITGTAVIKVQDETGGIVNEFRHDVANLAPAGSIAFDDAWDTSGAEEGSYRIVGYVLYDSRATSIEVVTVGTETYIYLPAILKSFQ